MAHDCFVRLPGQQWHNAFIKAGISVGEVFAILTYLIDLAEGLVVLPWTYQQSIRMQEIGGRMATA